MAKMPSEHAIQALASLFRGDIELDPFEQLLSCVAAVMFATGLRIQVVLHLSIDALRREGPRYFLYYFKAKSRRVVEERMALSAMQGELVAEALRKALAHTSGARLRAHELIRSTESFPMPPWTEYRHELSATETAELLGIQPATTSKLPDSVRRRRDAGSNAAYWGRSHAFSHPRGCAPRLEARRPRIQKRRVQG